MKITGTVSRKLINPGSKSERTAVTLADYVLRRLGTNPFVDPVLDALVGMDVEIDGTADLKPPSSKAGACCKTCK